MKLLWLTKGLGRGGAERLLVDAASMLERPDIDLHVAYVLPWKNDLVAELEDAGVTVTCLGAGPRAIGWPLRLARFLRSERFDVVHTHAPLPAAAARLCDRRATFVHTEHNTWDRYRAPTQAANAVTFRRNHRVVAVSGGVADSIGPRWMRRGVEPEVVLHGARIDRVLSGAGPRSEGRRRLGLAEDAFVVGTVGNCTPKKDHATLLRAFAKVARAMPTAHLVIIGSGPLEGETAELARTLGLARRVSFLGKRDDVPQLLPALDVFTLSSLFEGLPISLLEAMAAGVAVVATSVGGIPEAVTDGGNGLLVPAADPDALSSALSRLGRDEVLRTRLAASAAASSCDFDLGRAVAAMADIYEAVGR